MTDESLGDRLRRLRRDPAAQSKATGEGTAPAGPGAALPIWLKHKLAGAKAGRRAARVAGPAEPSAPKLIGAPRELKRAENQHGGFSYRETCLPEDHVHGSWKLNAVDQVVRADLARLGAEAVFGELDLRDAIYLDVETTGLSGGAGTTSFLVALGRFEGSEFKLWQGFLEGPEEEAAMLHAVAERVRASTWMVSFFGKSFDRHRLEDKMRLHHLEPPFEGLPHLDLYHPLHRIYKRSVPNGRLCTMEALLTDVRREDDLPGSFAPEAWFDYLGQRAHRLEAVFQHNADDVLSLVTLAAHLGRSGLETDPSGGELSGSSAARALAWASWHARHQSPAEALAWYARALQRAPALGADRLLRFDAGKWCRRLGRDSEALVHFRALSEEDVDGLACRALVEVAKIEEHVLKDADAWQRAAECVARAEALAAKLLGARARRLERELLQRAKRLSHKLERAKRAHDDSPRG